LIIRKIIKTAATRCPIVQLKYTKFDFGCGSAPDPARGAYSTPPDLLDLRGPTSKGREEGRKERATEGRGHIPLRQGEGFPPNLKANFARGRGGGTERQTDRVVIRTETGTRDKHVHTRAESNRFHARSRVTRVC